jgi:hypothetical protein
VVSHDNKSLLVGSTMLDFHEQLYRCFFLFSISCILGCVTEHVLKCQFIIHGGTQCRSQGTNHGVLHKQCTMSNLSKNMRKHILVHVMDFNYLTWILSLGVTKYKFFAQLHPPIPSLLLLLHP